MIHDYNCNPSEHLGLDTVLGFTGRADGMTGSPTLATVVHNAVLEQKNYHLNSQCLLGRHRQCVRIAGHDLPF